MAWQSAFSARHEQQWSNAEWEEWLAERSRQPWQCVLFGSMCRGKAKVRGQCGLRKAADDKGVTKTAASNPSSGGNPTVMTDGVKQMGSTCGSRASLSACIITLESTLSALPAGGPFEATRLYLQEEISEIQKEIAESKQLAMRMASCKGAVDRTAAKRLACQEAVERALQEFQ